jgi:hypothetical protein
MSKVKKEKLKAQDINALIMKIAFAALKSNCSCSVCLLGKQLADIIEANITIASKTAPKIIKTTEGETEGENS